MFLLCHFLLNLLLSGQILMMTARVELVILNLIMEGSTYVAKKKGEGERLLVKVDKYRDYLAFSLVLLIS